MRLPDCDTPGAEDVSGETPAVAVRARHVLVVEDNVGSAKVLAALLRKLGALRVEIAYDGKTALEMTRALEPDLILLDIGLPLMNGYEVAQRLRHEENYQGVIVALTGYGQQEDRQKSLECGFDQHLVKPPHLDQLQEVLVRRRAHPK